MMLLSSVHFIHGETRNARTMQNSITQGQSVGFEEDQPAPHPLNKYFVQKSEGVYFFLSFNE